MQTRLAEFKERELTLATNAQKLHRSRLSEVLNEVDKLKILSALFTRVRTLK